MNNMWIVIIQILTLTIAIWQFILYSTVVVFDEIKDDPIVFITQIMALIAFIV
jgi:hypothetical protein